MKKASFSIRAWLLISLLLLVLLAPIGLALFFYSGNVAGEEFSPDDFTRRRFSYNVVPWFNYTVRGIEYSDTTTVLEKTLVSDGLISPFKKTGNSKRRWDLIYDTKTPVTMSNDFDAVVLCQYLDLCNSDGENVWLAWNSNHPKLAKKFWPVIQKLAQNDIYWSIPPLMRQALAVKKEGCEVFANNLNRVAANSYIEVAGECQNQGNHQQAVELFSLAIELDPSREAFRGRSKSYRQLGDLEKSVADEQRASISD